MRQCIDAFKLAISNEKLAIVVHNPEKLADFAKFFQSRLKNLGINGIQVMCLQNFLIKEKLFQ